LNNSPEKRGQIIEHLEQALALADELGQASASACSRRSMHLAALIW
jgi:hypothetical protein